MNTDSFEAIQAVGKLAIGHATAALGTVLFFNSPDRFVVEVQSTKAPKQTKGAKKRVTRSDQRSRYIMLTPKQIRSQLDLGSEDTENHGTKRSHMRRRHFRFFRSERYTKMRGKSVVIEAHWVGPVERIIGNKRYKVCLNL